MEGADESTELWQHPFLSLNFFLNLSLYLSSLHRTLTFVATFSKSAFPSDFSVSLFFLLLLQEGAKNLELLCQTFHKF